MGYLMTLIITEISPYGIVMAADTALTFHEMTPSGRIRTRVLTGARKLQYIPYLDAGISMWGTGRIRTISGDLIMDIWLEDLIARYEGVESLEAFAEVMVDELQRNMGRSDQPLGFHLAGFCDKGNRKVPSFYHIRNCEGSYRDLEIHDFVAVHEFGPGVEREEPVNLWYNGDLGLFKAMIGGIEAGVSRIKMTSGFEIPHPSLEGRLRFYASIIRFISDLYHSSRLPREIGKEVDCLGIDADGTVIKFRE